MSAQVWGTAAPWPVCHRHEHPGDYQEAHPPLPRKSKKPAEVRLTSALYIYLPKTARHPAYSSPDVASLLFLRSPP